MRIRKFALIILIIVSLTTPILSACNNQNFDNSLPSLDEQDGWHRTLYTDFAEYSSLQEVYAKTPWSPSPHGLRKTEYWCDQSLSLDRENGALVISSTLEDNHVCDVCGVTSGVFTGGIETRATDDNEGFEQTFGYFEAVVKVPDAPGMWSAFWLQTSGTTKIGNQGKDGTEIDVYESSFHQHNRTSTGNALHYDAYDTIWYRCVDNVTDVGYDLYDGQYHKYALLWTPDYYVFYVDDAPVWTTDAGGVSRVGEFLRLTVGIRDTTYGPYGQKIGTFENRDDGSTDFCIKSVAVWQNDDFVPQIKSADDFDDCQKTYTLAITIGIISTVALIVAAVVVVTKRKING
ncbi:MAG: family 16 glycosylhydrolase [Christensenellales bacterium]